MQYERNGLLLAPAGENQQDKHILESFEAVAGSVETYEELAVDANRKEHILSSWHNGEDADLSVEAVDELVIQARIRSLREWKKWLVDSGEDSDMIQLYRWKVNEAIANANMLLASSQGDMRSFRRWNEFVYGQVDEDVYRAALDWIANDADILLANSDQPSVIEAATVVRDMLEGNRGYRELIAPDKETFEAVRDDHMRAKGFYGLVLAGTDLPDEGKISNDQGDDVLRYVVRENLKSSYNVADASAASWGVSHHTGAVLRPATYNMPVKRFIGLGLGHEIGSHLLERVNGERGPLALASKGLDRYENGNEGRALIREQVVYDSFDEFGSIVRWRDVLRRDIAIGYANGVGEGEAKSSSKVYAFINKIDQMYQLALAPADRQEALKKARDKTDTLLLRVLKGTDGNGGAYHKDKVYLEGHVDSWLTAAERGAEFISVGDLGKFDINNPRHIEALQRRGLLCSNDKEMPAA